MFSLSTTKISGFFSAIVACLVIASLTLLMYGNSSWSGKILDVPAAAPMEAPSQERVAITRHQALGDQGEELPTTRDEAVHTPSIPDHPPFLQDLKSAVVSHPWMNDSACQNYEVRLGVNIPPVYLVSFPRSGNTWTRYLVEGATGIFTGSVYTDKFLYKTGYLGEREKATSKKVLLIKDHLFRNKRLPTDTPAILLIRDPRAAVGSYLAYMKGHSVKGVDSFLYKGSVGDVTSKGQVKRIRNLVSFWKQVATTALTNPILLVLRYEDVKAEPIEAVRKILSFLKVSPDEGRLQCLAKHVEGKVNRGQPDLPPYTAEQNEVFKSAARSVSELLKKRGLAPLLYNY